MPCSTRQARLWLNICYCRWMSLLSGNDILTRNKRWYHLYEGGGNKLLVDNNCVMINNWQLEASNTSFLRLVLWMKACAK